MTSAPTAALASPQPEVSWRGAVSHLLRPSLTDVLFLGMLLWTVVLAPIGWQRLLQDADTGLHIRIGQFILQNGYVPTTDPLSFTRNGSHWLATEWLTGVLFAFLHSYFGLKAVVFLCGVTIAATLIVVLRTALLAGANSLIALVTVLLTLNAASFHYHARPHVFTWLFLAISLRLLSLDTRRIWLQVPLSALWANLHGGYAVLFPVLLIYLAGAALEGAPGRARLKRYSQLTMACALATLLNPFGYKLHLETIGYLRNKSVLSSIQEFQPPDFRSEPQMYFMALLFASLMICGFLLQKRRYTDALLIVAFAYLGLTSIRHIPLFLIVAVPILAVELSAHWNAWASRQKKTSLPGILFDLGASVRGRLPAISVWSVAVLAALWAVPSEASWPQDFQPDRFPVEMAGRHSAELTTSRLFTTDQWADYLMFKNPAQRVFIDDRVGYSPQIIADALKIMDTQEDWRAALERYRIDAVLCPNSAPLAMQLASVPGWKVVDQDTLCRLFRKAAP